MFYSSFLEFQRWLEGMASKKILLLGQTLGLAWSVFWAIFPVPLSGADPKVWAKIQTTRVSFNGNKTPRL
jgi:hypothetical protein